MLCERCAAFATVDDAEAVIRRFDSVGVGAVDAPHVSDREPRLSGPISNPLRRFGALQTKDQHWMIEISGRLGVAGPDSDAPCHGSR